MLAFRRGWRTNREMTGGDMTVNSEALDFPVCRRSGWLVCMSSRWLLSRPKEERVPSDAVTKGHPSKP